MLCSFFTKYVPLHSFAFIPLRSFPCPNSEPVRREGRKIEGKKIKGGLDRGGPQDVPARNFLTFKTSQMGRESG